MSSYTRQSRKKRELQQYVFDEYTKCRGLTQEELDEDVKLLKLSEYTAPSTRYKISNEIHKEKRQLITSIYDRKNIASDLAKQNNQLIDDLNSLKHQMKKQKDDIVHNQTQIIISKLQKEIVHRQFELMQQNKNKQIESLRKYRNQCKNSIAKTQNELNKLISITTESATTDEQLINALKYIKNLKNHLKNKEEIISKFNSNESNGGDLSKLNEKLNNIQKQSHQQIKANNVLREENKRINFELQETKKAFSDLMDIYKDLNNELTQTKYEKYNKINQFNQQQIYNQEQIELLEAKCNKYHEMTLLYAKQQNSNQTLNASISLDYYNQLILNDGLNKTNNILQDKYNNLDKKFKKINNNNNELSSYQLENIIIEEKKKNNNLLKQLHAEKQKYKDRVIGFKDDLDTLYRKTEGTAIENNRMKQDAKKKTLKLQRENDKLRDTLKQSHSNLRVKQTEHESKHKRSEQQHQQAVKQINGSKIDLEKRVDVLKKAISDLNGALSDCHIQMLTFQKQVFDEMNCSEPKDQLLMMQCINNNNNNKQQQQIQSIKHKKRSINKDNNNINNNNSNNNNNMNNNNNTNNTNNNNNNSRKRNRDEAIQNNPNTPNPKRRKKSHIHTDNNNTMSNSLSNSQSHSIHDDDIEDIDSSSSSELSHASHLADDELYNFQGLMENMDITDTDRIFYSILANSKTDGYILLNDYIKITRRGHPDYTGRVESMFFEKESNKKKVCVTIFQLASDIPNIHECRIINGVDDEINNKFQEGKREYVQLALSKKHHQFPSQSIDTKIFGVGRIHTNKKVTLWFPRRNLHFKAIEKKTSGRDVFFSRYKYDKNEKTLTRIDGTDDKPISDYQVTKSLMNLLRNTLQRVSKARFSEIRHEQISFGLQHEFMDAVVTYGPQDYKYEKRKIPIDLEPDEVLINVSRVGICAGDTKCYLGAPLFWAPNEFGEPYCQYGVTAGHEFIGNVVGLGDDAADLYGLEVGDQAIAEQIVPCNVCELCRSGDYNMCNPWNGRYRSPHEIYGFRTMCNGGMANYMKYVHNSRIHKVPKEIPAGHAVYIEPLGCGIHAANRADIQLNDVVVISGAGAVGLGALCAAKMKSPKKIVVLDLDDDKLKIAKKCGADEVWNPLKMDVVKSIMEITNFYGCHKYIEATGAPQSVVKGLEMLRRKGTFVEYSVFKDDVTVNLTKISDEKEINLKGGHLGPHCYPTAIRMLQDGTVPAADIVTHCYPMSEFMKGFCTVDRAIKPPPGFTPDKFSIKVTLDPEK